jgi:hypothetical protein
MAGGVKCFLGGDAVGEIGMEIREKGKCKEILPGNKLDRIVGICDKVSGNFDAGCNGKLPCSSTAYVRLWLRRGLRQFKPRSP